MCIVAERNPEDWALSNWAKMVSASKIVECTDSNKAFLGNKEVKKRKQAPRPTRMPKENPTYVHRQKRRHHLQDNNNFSVSLA